MVVALQNLIWGVWENFMATKVIAASTRDVVRDAIAKAERAVMLAALEANGDTRTNGTVCTDHLEAANKSIHAAREWLAEYIVEERREARPEAKAMPVNAAIVRVECEGCGASIAPGDVSICSGCDKPVCPDCMGDNEVCLKCDEDDA